MDEYGQDTTLADYSSGSSSSDVWSSLFSSAASVVNTGIIANANPVNAALLTNQPLTTPQYVVGAGATMTSSSTFLLVALAVGGVILFAAMRK